MPGADIGSDHNLVLLTFKLKLKKNMQSEEMETLRDLVSIWSKSMEQIRSSQLVGGRHQFPDGTINEIPMKTAEEVQGKRKKKIKPWSQMIYLTFVKKDEI